MEINNFMDLWSQIAILKRPVSLDILEGVILVEQDGGRSWVYLPSDDLGFIYNTLTSGFICL
ncbi:hypothetical protein Hanom_Chr12g01096741 [Helianthus anomalus]